jgi:hypothetical protein
MSPLKLYLAISASKFEKICLSKSLFCTNEELDGEIYRKQINQLSISGWNVNGIFKNSSGAKTCKLEDEYFNEIMKSDIVFLSETHTSFSDPLSYYNYKCYINCRSNEPSRKRGGLAVFTKKWQM